MTEPIDTTPSPSAMPTHLPGAEPEQPEHKRQWTSEEYDAEITKVRKEAAGWRTKLREAESQLGAMRRTEVERHAAEHLRDGTDIWQAQFDLAEFVNDDGTIATDKITETALALAAEKPHYSAPPTGRPPSDRPVEGLRAGATPADYNGPTQPTWADVIPRPPHSRMAGGE